MSQVEPALGLSSLGLCYDDPLSALEVRWALGSCLTKRAVRLLTKALSHPPSPGAGCRAKSHMDHQEFLSRGHGQRQPPALCHYPGKPRQVSGSSVPTPATPAACPEQVSGPES